jgi:cytoskeleton protein RodZ
MAAQHARGDVGRMLREARERRGLSLRQISNATKIAMMTLEALERNDVARLPGGIFSRSFVRAYALEVGLDPEVVIEQFMGQFPQDSVTAGHPTTSQIEDHEAVESDRRTASTLLRLIAISVPIAAIVVYFGTAGRRTVGSQQPTVGSQQPAVDSQLSAVDSQQPTVDRQRPTAGSQQSALDAPRQAVETPAAAPAVEAPAPLAAAPGDRFVVQVTATRRSWIGAIVDGSRAAQREFSPGEESSFEVRREIVLTAGDAGGVVVTFNGLPTRPLGGNGQVVTWRVNLANFKAYLVTP